MLHENRYPIDTEFNWLDNIFVEFFGMFWIISMQFVSFSFDYMLFYAHLALFFRVIIAIIEANW